MLKLFGHPDSGNSYKVKLCLSIGKVEHDYQVIDISLPEISDLKTFKINPSFKKYHY